MSGRSTIGSLFAAGTFLISWTVGGGTGIFMGATGSGTDAPTAAGLHGTGSITGTITIP